MRRILSVLPANAAMESDISISTKGRLFRSPHVLRFCSCHGTDFIKHVPLYLQFDGGGFRWPFMFDMCITTLMIGSVLLGVQMALKQAAGPAVGAIFVTVPTFLFRNNMKARFSRAFEDAALLQTSLLDGWDNAHDYSVQKREEFRQFLVDAHKAAYVSS